MLQTIIITDLDGTLLDAASYSWADARPALRLLRARDVPLILCSSKTRAEIEALRHDLHNHHPFISENGGGLFIPRGYFAASFVAEECGAYRLVALGTPYAEIRRRFTSLRERLGVRARGFGDMTVEEVAALTGLGPEEARRAQQRDFDEPFVFEGEPDERLLRAIEAEGLNWTEGRLFHVLGRHDKGRAVHLLRELFERERGAVQVIALGDGYNDLPLLRAADSPVLVMRPDGGFEPRVDFDGLARTRLPGPAGWSRAVLQRLLGEAGATLATIYEAALAAVEPRMAVRDALTLEGDMLYAGEECYDLAAFERILVVGGGKAAAFMAQAVEEVLGARIAQGLVVVKRGHVAPLSRIEQVEAAHPVPDEAGAAGAGRILDLVRAADEKTLVICLLSGGASALLAAPAAGLTLQDKQAATDLLLRAGADIGETNAVRKHLSALKGGRLAEAAFPAQVLTLLLSDVIGDRLDVIASGPTAPDVSSYAEALDVIGKYGLQDDMPESVMIHLRRGAEGKIAETAKGNGRCFSRVRNVIVASLAQAMLAAEGKARELGLEVGILRQDLQGEAREAAHWLAGMARAELAGMPPGTSRCLLCGGETTVTVRGGGLGGRNQELALAFALEEDGKTGITLLSVATDGGDGPTNACGALVDGNTAGLAREFGLEPRACLDNNDSYHFFSGLDMRAGCFSHYLTGPTGTNVMDMQLLLLAKPPLTE